MPPPDSRTSSQPAIQGGAVTSAEIEVCGLFADEIELIETKTLQTNSKDE